MYDEWHVKSYFRHDSWPINISERLSGRLEARDLSVTLAQVRGWFLRPDEEKWKIPSAEGNVTTIKVRTEEC